MRIMVVVLLWFAGNAFANDPCNRFYQDSIQDADIDATYVYALLNSQRGRGCILGDSDTSGIKAQYQQLFQSTLPPEDVAIARGQLLELLVSEFDGESERICAGLTTDCVVGRHADALSQLASGINAGEFDLITASLSDWFPTEADGSINSSSVVLADYLKSECKAGIGAPACAAAVEVAAKVMRTSLAVDQLIVSHRQPVIGVNDRFLSGRDREWEAYLNGASVQYPWELAFNGWRFDRTAEGQDEFPRAPSSRWVLLHPSPAFEVIDSAGSSNSVEAAITLEVFGYQQWQWRGGQQRNRWGVSGIVSVADINGMDTLGYGVLVHTPVSNTALGIIWRDGNDGSEIGVVLNLDMAKLLKQYNNADLRSFVDR